MEALTAQLQSSLQAGNFSQLAPICDAAELQVSYRLDRVLSTVGCLGGFDHNYIWTLTWLQEPSGSFPPQWPFALHLLAHIYSSNL